MKRVYIENDVLYPILPEELWPGILRYVSIWHRYQFLTVCKAWAEPRGLLDQSVYSLHKTDYLPIDLSRLVNLTDLATCYSRDRQEMLDKGVCKKLVSLDLGYEDGIYGSSAIALFTELRCLSFSVGMVGYGQVLPRFAMLRVLRVYSAINARHDVDDYAIGGLTTLTDLTLHRTRVSDASLTMLKALKYLNLYYNPDITATSIGQLTQLRSLELIGNESSAHGCLYGLTDLTSLNLDSNDVLRAEDVVHLTSLVSLNLNDNLMVMPHFPHLTQLIVSNAFTTDENGLRVDITHNLSLSRLTQLKELHFHSVHGFIPDDTLKCLTSLTSLHITGTRDITTSSLALLSNLVNLELSYMKLTDFDVSCLPLSICRLDLTYSSDWCAMIVPLSRRFTNLTDLTLGHAHPVAYCGCNRGLHSFHSLQRLQYTPYLLHNHRAKSMGLDTLPRHVELTKY